MKSHTTVGTANAIVRKYILTEGSPVVLPTQYERLHAEVVVDSETETEVLELWLAVPNIPTPDVSGPSKGPQTIYTQTTIVDEDAAPDEQAFRAEIEREIEEELKNYDVYEEPDEWD